MHRFSLMEGAAAASIAAVALSGCAVHEVRSTSCAVYVRYDTLAEAAAEADLIARATVTYENNPLEIQLVDVVKGSLSAGDTVTVSAPSTCDPVSPPQGTKDVVVLLVKHGMEWAPINPDQGLSIFNSSQFDSLR